MAQDDDKEVGPGEALVCGLVLLLVVWLMALRGLIYVFFGGKEMPEVDCSGPYTAEDYIDYDGSVEDAIDF